MWGDLCVRLHAELNCVVQLIHIDMIVALHVRRASLGLSRAELRGILNFMPCGKVVGEVGCIWGWVVCHWTVGGWAAGVSNGTSWVAHTWKRAGTPPRRLVLGGVV